MTCVYYGDTLCHFGIPGMKWGVRKKSDLVGQGPYRGTVNNQAVRGQAVQPGTQGKRFQVSDRTKYMIKSGLELTVLALAAYSGYKSYQMGKMRQAGNQAVQNLISSAPEVASAAASASAVSTATESSVA